MQRRGNSSAPPHDCQSSVAVLALLVFRLIRTHVLVIFVVLHLTVLALFVLCFLLRTIFSCIIFRHKNFLRSKIFFYEGLFTFRLYFSSKFRFYSFMRSLYAKLCLTRGFFRIITRFWRIKIHVDKAAEKW